MSLNLHLLGGTGRIGTALSDSIDSSPFKNTVKVLIYCEGNKATKYNSIKYVKNPNINFVSYSAFNFKRLIKNGNIEILDKNIIFNLRGVNNKKDWLNEPLNSLELQMQSCIQLLDSDIWMYPNTEIIHLSSQLCDLIEGEDTIAEICENEDSYRKPYMISRLHQESLLTAYAFKKGIKTNFLRLPFVYGFLTDKEKQFFIYSFVNDLLNKGKIDLRKPDSYLWFLHKDYLIKYLRNLIREIFLNQVTTKTVSYLDCPMIGIKGNDLANFIVEYINNKRDDIISELNNNLDIRKINNQTDASEQIQKLTLYINSLISNK